MGKNAKLGIAALLVLVLAYLAFSMGGPLLGIVVLVGGGLGVVVLLQRLPDDEGGGEGGGKQLKGKKKLDAYLESKNDEGKPTNRSSTATVAPSGDGLPTWGGGLDTWTPPADDIEVVEDEPVGNLDSWDSGFSDDYSDEPESDTLVLDDPLDNLDVLDEIDPVAEVERLDAMYEEEDTFSVDEIDLDEGVEVEEERPPAKSSGGFSFSSAPPVINEEVESADDIMAASQATELSADITGGDAADSELAKLLAKVQARLAAYE